ncbi:MAG: ABC transporter permease [Nocardioidaceae bacterium]|nr:ABC transporter permease [Nocardioidaceae bacterium]MCL2611624.1 ABC transporter permease [Nocardioidaceae bacterium]
MTVPTGSAALGLRDGTLRQADYWAALWRRTWRGVLATSFLSPLLYVLALGVLLGGFIKADPARMEGATSYLAFVVPGLIAAHAMQLAVGEATYPVMGMIKWRPTYQAMLATPLQARHVVAAHLTTIALHLAAATGIYMLVMVPFGVYATWWGASLAWLTQIGVGMAFAVWIYGITCRLRNEEGFGLIFRLGVFPMFLFSGAFFPVANLGRVGAAIARCTPLWQGVNLSRMLTIDHITWWIAAINAGVIVLLLVGGWRWAHTGLERRMIT